MQQGFMGNSEIPVLVIALSPNASSTFTNDSTSDETKEYQLSIINERRLSGMISNRESADDERRLSRMISNRESAQISRMRKKKQIQDLQSQVNHLQTVNHQLSKKFVHLLECNHQILQENAQLKEKVSSLQIILSDMLFPLTNL